MIKYVEILVQVRYFIRNDKVFQYFIVSNEKLSKYILENNYILYDNFNNKIRELAIQENVEFLEKREENDRIVFEYTKLENFVRPKSAFFTIAGFITTTKSCEYCKHFDEDNFFCYKKNKTLQNKLKNCSVFKQKEGLYKT